MEAVVDAFLDDNSLKIIDNPDNADLVLDGVIMPVNRRATSITQDETLENEQIYVSLNLDCRIQGQEKSLWKSNLRDFGDISGSGNTEEIEAALDDAVEKLVEKIVNQTVAAW